MAAWVFSQFSCVSAQGLPVCMHLWSESLTGASFDDGQFMLWGAQDTPCTKWIGRNGQKIASVLTLDFTSHFIMNAFSRQK